MKTIKEHLSAETKTPLHEHLLKLITTNTRNSRNTMQKFYPVWDDCHKAYKRKMDVNQKDVEAKSRGLPAKVVTPLTYSNIQTAVAFCFLLLQQKEVMFEFDPKEGQDPTIRECCESVVDRDWQYSQGDTVLMQFFLNVFRFGIGVTAESWTEDVSYVPVDTTTPPVMVGGVVAQEGFPRTTYEKVVKFQGNIIRNISPYKFFPDPAVHLTDWRRGSFVAIESEYSKRELADLERNDKVHGVGYVVTMTDATWREMGRANGGSRLLSFKPDNKDSNTFVVTEYYQWFVPSETYAEEEPNEKLGEEQFPILYLVWVANDSRVVRCEPLNAVHNSWPISVGFFSPDQHDLEVSSMATIGDDLQVIHSWLINSRIGAVTRMIDGQVVASPLMMDMNTVENRHRVLRTTKAGAQRAIDTFFKALPIQDTTQGHFQDMAVVKDFVQSVTGVNDNMMGIPSSGRRAATEMRNVMGGASSRMKLIVKVIWSNALVPLANRLRTNHRQALSIEQFTAVCGQTAADTYFAKFRATPTELAAEYDFIVMDGTLPSEKGYLAQSYQEILMMLMQVPEAALMFDLDAKKLFKKISKLRGLGDMEDVAMDEVERQRIQQVQAQQMALQAQLKSAGKPTPTAS